VRAGGGRGLTSAHMANGGSKGDQRGSPCHRHVHPCHPSAHALAACQVRLGGALFVN